MLKRKNNSHNSLETTNIGIDETPFQQKENTQNLLMLFDDELCIDHTLIAKNNNFPRKPQYPETNGKNKYQHKSKTTNHTTLQVANYNSLQTSPNNAHIAIRNIAQPINFDTITLHELLSTYKIKVTNKLPTTTANREKKFKAQQSLLAKKTKPSKNKITTHHDLELTIPKRYIERRNIAQPINFDTITLHKLLSTYDIKEGINLPPTNSNPEKKTKSYQSLLPTNNNPPKNNATTHHDLELISYNNEQTTIHTWKNKAQSINFDTIALHELLSIYDVNKESKLPPTTATNDNNIQLTNTLSSLLKNNTTHNPPISQTTATNDANFITTISPTNFTRQYQLHTEPIYPTFNTTKTLPNFFVTPCQLPKQAPTSTEMNWDLYEASESIPPTLSKPSTNTFEETKLVSLKPNSYNKKESETPINIQKVNTLCNFQTLKETQPKIFSHTYQQII